MTKQTKIIVAAVVALLLYLLFFRKKSSAEQLVEDVTHNQPPQVPAFGTDQIIDAADATATLSLELPAPINYQQYIGKIS